MSSLALHTWNLGWVRPGRTRHTHEAAGSLEPRERVGPARWWGPLAFAAMLAIGVATAALTFASPQRELARRTLEAENVQNLSFVWLTQQSPERVWEPQLALMLPVTAPTAAKTVPGS
jgi:hypothetical protein